jgi:PadR family transcriptional regulator, regulatory protein AphA
MASPPTATSFALLGLLGIQSWTAYELVVQSKRSLHYFWPRSEAHLYAELKRIVERGHADAEVVEGPKRQRTRYTITPLGREALDEWLSREPTPPTFEIEGLLRLFLGDQGTKEQLRAALEATAAQVREVRTQGAALCTDVLDTGGPFPQRLHLIAPISTFYDGFYRLLIQWCDDTAAELDAWPDTRDVGMTPEVRERFQRLLALPAP